MYWATVQRPNHIFCNSYNSIHIPMCILFITIVTTLRLNLGTTMKPYNVIPTARKLGFLQLSVVAHVVDEIVPSEHLLSGL